MLDIKFIRENAAAVKKGAADKHIQCDVDRLLAVDERRRALQLRRCILGSGDLPGGTATPQSLQTLNPSSGADSVGPNGTTLGSPR